MPPRKSNPKSSKGNSAPRRKSRPAAASNLGSAGIPAGSWASPLPSTIGPAFQKLVAVMARLRAPNGCPWDREQTHATLRTYLIEEAYEVLDALDSTDDAKFAEELGDLLLQVLFHAQIANEEGRFNISDVIRGIYEKMIRRHPHVFGAKQAKTAADVLRNWEIIKQQERQAKEAQSAASIVPSGGHPVPRRRRALARPPASQGESASAALSSNSTSNPASLLDGVPRTLPALLEALQLTRKAARIGFDWHSIDGIFAKLQEETSELQSALAASAGLQDSTQPSGPGVADLRVGSAPVAEGESRSPAALRQNRRGRANGTRGRSFSSDIESSDKGRALAPEELVSPSIESELGDILFVAVNLARFLDLDPEIALKKSNAKFSRRFREMERLAREQGTTLAQLPRPQMESLWDQVKLLEPSSS